MKSIAFIALTTEGSFNSDEFTEKVIETVERVNQDQDSGNIAGYELVDTRSIVQMGASAATEEIVLAIATGVAEGMAGALIYGLSSWLVDKYGSRSASSQSQELDVERVKRILIGSFSPRGHLEILEQTPSRVKLKDRKGTIFEAETMQGSPESLIIKKQRNENGNQ